MISAVRQSDEATIDKMSDVVSFPNVRAFLRCFEQEGILGQGAFGHVVLAQRISDDWFVFTNGSEPGLDEVDGACTSPPPPSGPPPRPLGPRTRLCSHGSDLDVGEIVTTMPDAVAVKKIPRMDSNGFKLAREVRVLDDLDHENVVKSFLAASDKCYFYIVMELCRTSLSKIISERKEAVVSATLIRPLVRQIVTGVAFLHTKGITHRDLKPANVLVVVPDDMLEALGVDQTGLEAWLWDQDLTRLTLKIADFGLSRFLPNNESSVRSLSVEGTECYMSPQMAKAFKERLGKLSYDGHKTDVFSTGLLVYKLLTKETLFEQEMLASEATGALVRPVLKRNVTDKALRSLLRRMLRWEEDRRLTIEEVAKHRYFLGG